MTLRLLEIEDAEAILDYYVRNRDHLRPWIPILPTDFYTIEFQRKRLRTYLGLAAHAEEFRFGVFDEQRIAASINLTAIEYGAFMNGRLGYSVDAQYAGKGLATEYVGYVCEFAFTRLGLHRVEANVMPRNIGSRRVLEKCGFQKVGYSPRMVKIAGAWEDHDMFAKTSEG